jgi:hypothetical protein
MLLPDDYSGCLDLSAFEGMATTHISAPKGSSVQSSKENYSLKPDIRNYV